MKTFRYLATAMLVALTVTGALAQAPSPASIPLRGIEPPSAPKLTKFTLDFTGGTPRQLTAAIQKAMDKPLNVIIPDEFAETKLPPLKMNNVDVAQLFQALEQASGKTEAYVTSTYYGGGGRSMPSYQQMRTSYGFRTQGVPNDDSIWYFSVEKPSMPPLSQPPPKVCHFYPLAAYIERGQTVDDITTAIQTGWKMLGDKDTPVISFHKDTKLLIAVGEESKLETIDAVLRALQSPSGDMIREQPRRSPLPSGPSAPAKPRTGD